MKPVAGKKDDVLKLFMSDDRINSGAVKGFRAGYILEDASGDLYGFAVFDDEKTYRDNAADPAQDKWYRQMRAMLQADPEWHDGKIEVAPA